MLLEPRVRPGGRVRSRQPTGGAWSKENRCEHPGKVQGERKPRNYQRTRNRQEPESQEMKLKEQGVRGGEWPPAITKDKEKQVSAGFATRMIYQKGVIGFAGKCGSQGGGVGTDPHVLRSVWEARQVAGTASEQASAMQGREIRTQLQGNASRLSWECFHDFFFQR